jgi:mono/diheme cytochrome c family protein
MKQGLRLTWVGAGMILVATGCGGDEPSVGPPPPVPAEYQDKHMPEGWWTDPAVIEEGKAIFEGKDDPDVNCASCHGREGKPKKKGARDFRVQERLKLYSDSFWFWRISEGVPRTKMKAWKDKLSEEQRWKVMAYEHTFSHGNQPAPHDDYVKPAGEAK